MSPITFSRFLLRMAAIAVVTMILHSFVRIRQIVRRERRRPTDIVGLWGKCLCWIMGIRVCFRNQRSGPRGAILVANHMGFLDIPVLLSVFPAVFIIKAELGRLPLAGRALRNEKHIFVDRDNSVSLRKAGDELAAAVRAGDPVIVFPEGRGKSGAERLPFKPYSFVVAAQLRKPIEVVLIDYLPDRQAAAWDSGRAMFPQFAALLGKKRHYVGIEYLASYIPENPKEDADRFRRDIEHRLRTYTGESWGVPEK